MGKAPLLVIELVQAAIHAKGGDLRARREEPKGPEGRIKEGSYSRRGKLN
jgi:hypothetical protein